MRTAGPRLGFFRGHRCRASATSSAHRELLGCSSGASSRPATRTARSASSGASIRPLAMLLIYYVAIGKFLGAEPRQHPRLRDLHLHRPDRVDAVHRDRRRRAPASIVANSGLIKKVYLPREVFPLSVVGSALFNFAHPARSSSSARPSSLGQFPTGARWLVLRRSSLAVLIVVRARRSRCSCSAVNVYLRDVQYLVEIAHHDLLLGLADRLLVGAGRATTLDERALARGALPRQPDDARRPRLPATFWVAGDGQPVPARPRRPAWGSRSASRSCSSGSCQRVFARLQGNFAQEL